jgi:formylglycine-generating enzyme required for sulfatase activity
MQGGSAARSVMRLEALEMERVWVPPGEFHMGAALTDEEVDGEEGPLRWVCLREGFWLGRFPVTIAQFNRVMEATGGEPPAEGRPAGFDHPEMPVTGVSWEHAVDWCRRASGVAGVCVDLPTEAEWEWAARGSDGRTYPWGEAAPTPERAHFSGMASPEGPAPVGERPAGAGPFGAEEQAGNVWEWCHEGLDRDRTPPGVESRRVVRGGCWASTARWLRATSRGEDLRWDRFDLDLVGFRVVFRDLPLGA